jgi:hypothetical protein
MSITYDESQYRKVVAAMDKLASFEGIAAWDRLAQDEVKQVEQHIQVLDRELFQNQQALIKARQDYSNKNFIAKLFGGRREIDRINGALTGLASQKQYCEDLAEQLQAHVDFTPNDTEEQKVLIKLLKQHKKELQQQKRELASDARQIRVAARQATANIGPNYGSKFVGRLNASQRRNIRFQKEAALAPNEDAKTAIERQLIAVERRIIWAERFSS